MSFVHYITIVVEIANYQEHVPLTLVPVTLFCLNIFFISLSNKLTVEFSEDPLNEGNLLQHDLVQSVPVALGVLGGSLFDGWAVRFDPGITGDTCFSEPEK